MKRQEETFEIEELEDENEDNFDKIYKGEVSKSGTAILPSKRVRKIPEKVDNDSKIQDVGIANKNEESKQQIETASLPADNKSEK